MKLDVFGDWHGNKTFALKQVELSDADVLFQVGDFGIWPQTLNGAHSFVHSLEKLLSEQGRELWFIDGNHEDFDIINSLDIDDRGLNQITDHIFHVPRGHSWDWDGVKFAGLGGAVSVDRNYRTLGKSYFKEEEITDADVKRAVSAGKVDVLLSHEAPILPVPPRFFSESINRDSHESISKMGKVMSELSPKLLVHGHYHHPYYRRVLDTDVVGLDCDLGTLKNNKLSIDLSEIKSLPL